MDSKMRVFVTNISYALSSNILSLVISTLVILIVPKLIGLESYGNWQLYMFYSSYVGFFQFGWNDGVYLRYGGKEYNELNKILFFSQFWMLVFFQLIVAVIINVISLIFISQAEKQFIIMMVSLCMIIMGIRALLLFTLQATTRIKEYAILTMIDRIIYCCLIISFLLFGVRKYELMIAADLIGKFISLLYAIYYCKDIVFHEISSFYFSFKETLENINVGIKLMFSNISSMLIIGVVRFGIERAWGVITFGKISLALSISNLMMLFINSVGVILFPILRRTEERKLPNIYLTMRDFLMVTLLGFLLIYFPLKVILSIWLPEYLESLRYMSLVFPMCLYEGKMVLLINTFLKTIREEKAILRINLISLCISTLLTCVSIIYFNNLNLTVLSIVTTLAFRCTISELYLSKILKISVYRDIFLESIMTLFFLWLGWFGILNSATIYALVYVMYLFIKKKDIVRSRVNLKLLLKA
jgi:O-antigen/teichoic acid export membrane protein